jgi:hypothetical protein
VILYQALSGRPPFEGKDSVAVLAAAMTQSAPPLGPQCPSASPALIRLIEAAMSRDRDKRPPSAAAFSTRLHSATADASPVASPSAAPAFNATSLAALDSAVLVDLAGGPVQLTPPPVACYVDPGFVAPPEEDIAIEIDEPAPAVKAAASSPRETHVMSAGERVPRRGAARLARWLIPLAVAGAVAVVVGPRVLKSAPEPAPVSVEAPPRALVQFDVSPQGSQLFLDGAPLVSNPVSLGKGEMHTVTAVAQGYDVGASKFFVDQAKTVRLKLERGRGRH